MNKLNYNQRASILLGMLALSFMGLSSKHYVCRSERHGLVSLEKYTELNPLGVLEDLVTTAEQQGTYHEMPRAVVRCHDRAVKMGRSDVSARDVLLALPTIVDHVMPTEATLHERGAVGFDRRATKVRAQFEESVDNYCADIQQLINDIYAVSSGWRTGYDEALLVIEERVAQAKELLVNGQMVVTTTCNV